MPFDVSEFVLRTLSEDSRPSDGLLHSSSHLTTPLRHVQLEMAGAPETPRSINDLITLKTGTLWHEYLESALKATHMPLMSEVNLTPWMPEGWSGTADWFVWSKEHKAFVLGDVKTVKGAGLPWILKDGAKEAHWWQVSSYWYAARDMGIPLVEGFAIAYLPKDGNLDITVIDCKMVDESLLHAVMAQRKADVDEYLMEPYPQYLAPIPERELKRSWNAKAKVFDLILKPHWSSMYCRFNDCGCGERGQTKAGHFRLEDCGDVTWVPRNAVKQEDDWPREHQIEALTPKPKEFK